MKRSVILALVLLFALLLAACGSAAPAATATAVPEPTATTAPATTMAPAATDTPAAAPTDTPAAADEGDADSGALLFAQNGCSGCHGAQAGGGGGPKLAGRGLEVEFVLGKVREGPGGMPEFTNDRVSDADVHDIVAWLSSL